MKKQLLDELNLRLAAMENEITTLQNQIRKPQPTYMHRQRPYPDENAP